MIGGGTLCRDCGVDAWHQDGDVHEDFYVHNELWDRVCPDDEVQEGSHGSRNGNFVLCIGCFEGRLGRKLRPKDFKAMASALFGTPPSER